MKKIISIILSVILLVSTVMVSCFAEDSEAWKNNTGEINLTAMTASGSGIVIKDNVISISEGGDFSVTGTLADGMIYVNTTDKVKLRLSGANITNSTGPAIFFDNAEKAFITITENTENYLADGAEYTSEDADAVLFSNDDLEIKGSGILNITGNYKHGIAGDDDVAIENGIINIVANEHGIKANDTLSVSGGTMNITAKTGKGMKAGTEVIIDDGAITINSEQSEGIESKGTLTINGGDINITSADDGINTGNESSETDSASQMTGGGKGQRPMPENDGEIPEMPEMPQGERGQKPFNTNGGVMPNMSDMPQGKQNQQLPQSGDGTMPQRSQVGGRGNRTPQTNGDTALPNGEQLPQDGSAPNDMVMGGRGKGDGFGGGMGMVDEETAAAHAITINGGKIYIKANGDGIDSNGSLTINGGEVIIDGPASSGNGPIDSQGKMSINGGSVFTVSSAGMLQLPTDTEGQNILRVILSERQSAGSEVSIRKSENGSESELISYTPERDYQAVVFSSAEIESGKEYVIYINDEKYETVTAVKGTTSVGNSVGGNKGGIGGRFENRESENEIMVTVNGNKINFNTKPVIKSDTTLVGFRAILEALDADVEWDNDTQTVTAKKDGTIIILQIGSRTAYVNGEERGLLLAPEIINDSTMIPVRFISEQLGMNVNWVEESQLIEVTQ